MNALTNITMLAALTTAIGWTMLFAGSKKRMVEMRARKRVCPACGRKIAGRVCDNHG